MTKEEFLQKISQVDWFFEYIEDFCRFKREQALYLEVLAAAQNNIEFKEIFKKYDKRKS